MDGRLPPTVDESQKLVLLNDEGAPMVYMPLILVDDPVELKDYARGLWWQWQALEKNDPMATSFKFPKTAIRKALGWLLGCYAEAQTPIPAEVALLANAILAPVPKDTSGLPSGTLPVRKHIVSAYMAAARYKAENATCTALDIAKVLCEKGILDNTQTPDKFRTTVEDWFNTEHFEQAVEAYRRSSG